MKIYSQGVHEYTVKTKGNKTKVKASHASDWSEEYQGKTLATMIDTGDDIVIRFDNEEVIILDYSQAKYVQLLINAIENL